VFDAAQAYVANPTTKRQTAALSMSIRLIGHPLLFEKNFSSGLHRLGPP
jgi:hypothetical protein